MGIDKDEEHCEVLVKREMKDDKTKVLPEIMFLFPHGLLQQFNMKMGDPGPMALRRKR